MVSNHWLRRGLGVGTASLIGGLVFACSSSSDNKNSGGADASGGAVEALLEPGAGTCASPGGPVFGPQDDHCEAPDGGAIVQVTTAAGCTAVVATDGGGDSGAGGDGGAPDAGDIGNCGDLAYGPTMDNNWGADDDCKYDIMWTSTPICENQPVYFVVQASKRTDNSPLTGANARPDVVLNCGHPITNLPRDPSPEIAPGVYVVGPIVFDTPGKWVFRFHFNEDCLDEAPDSPHGHAAFYVQVP
jgi:hypothetical protein